MEVSNQTEKDIQLYEYILRKSKTPLEQTNPFRASMAAVTHVLFKAITMMLFYFDELFNELITESVTGELTTLFVVLDFWFTKNFNSRRLIGLRWYYGEDEHKVERFMFEARVNDEYVNNIYSKLFWLVQIVYLIIPIVDITTTIIISPNIYRVNFAKVLINLIVIAGGLSNLYLFYKAHAASYQKKIDFRTKFGYQFVFKLGSNSMVGTL